MEKINYKIETVSSLIISMRGSEAWYQGLDFEIGDVNIQKVNGTKRLEKSPKVIYPFYQYGEYAEYNPQEAEYYIPGSSIKGMLFWEKKKKKGVDDFRIDDVQIPKGKIVLQNLYKAQYIKEDQRKWDIYFDNVAVEMLKEKTKLTGECYLESKDEAKKLFSAANRSAAKRIAQMLKYLKGFKKVEQEDFLTELNTVIRNLEALAKEQNIFLLGGYKGLLHSIEMEMQGTTKKDEQYGAVYLDRITMLPHGLVRMTIL